MPIVIVANDPRDWPFQTPNVEVIDARSYLTRPEHSDLRGVKLFNLCRSYRYQSEGYYVSLLAEARGHRPLPSVTTIQDLKSQSMVRLVSDDLEEIIQESLSPIHADKFTLTIYFGKNLAKRHERLSLHLFNLFQAPMLALSSFEMSAGSCGSICALPTSEIPESHREFVVQVASEYFAGKRPRVKRPAPARYDLGILYAADQPEAPSNARAIQKFVKAAASLGLDAEVIGRDDFARLAEFDALFIRDTTAVNHHTYRFARRAASEGLVVIDDPESIVKCTNKVYLAELMNRHDVPTPRTLVVHKENVDAIPRDLGFPCVLKKPDSAFSMGVVKVESQHALNEQLERFLDESDLVVAQEFLPTTFDWRITVLDRRPLFACKYFMAANHWQIIKRDGGGKKEFGNFETLPVEVAPRKAVRLALKAADLIGDGLYGVDIKQSGNRFYVIEINDNPSIDAGIEDSILRDELYRRVMAVFLARIEQRKAVQSMSRKPLHLFEGFGVELEYMIVDADTLSVRPIADEVLKAVAGKIVDNVDMPGGITWSNELALHVLELKGTKPLSQPAGWAEEFQKNVRHVNEVLQPMHARLMPTAMHPWMNPHTEMKIWPHEYSAVYEAFNRIFDCRGHGWANLQSVHLNLPFANDEEFAKLHAAIRFLLPILPALTASSPIVDGHVTGFLDTRMEVYRKNSARIPSVAGAIIPEQAFTHREYEEKILKPMYADVAPHDTEGILQEEFLNARGAIARFSRGAIEIRVLDVQECPAADLAICSFIVGVLKLLMDDPMRVDRMREYPTEPLHHLLLDSIRDGGNADILDPAYASILGMKRTPGWCLELVWANLFERTAHNLDREARQVIEVICDQGSLARRILAAVGNMPTEARIAHVYRHLSRCLKKGQLFVEDTTPEPDHAA